MTSIQLPPVPKSVGVDLTAALQRRRTTREFDSERQVPPEALSAVLWAANGVNGPEDKRTAPSAFGGNQVNVSLITALGVFVYDAASHTLNPVAEGDFRRGLAPDDWVDTAAVQVVLSGRTDKFPDFVTPQFAIELLQATAGCIAENIHLMAAALGLGTCMVGHMNADKVRAALSLEDAEVPLYVMPVGYPK